MAARPRGGAILPDDNTLPTTEALARALAGPLLLQPDNFTDQMWGGDWIPRMKGLAVPVGPVGESWELSGHAERPSVALMPEGPASLAAIAARAPSALMGPALGRRFGGRLPFLLKLIDPRDDLSVQVHPDDDGARRLGDDGGKAEAWIVLDVDRSVGPGLLYLGFDPERVEAHGDHFAEAFLAAIGQANGQGPSEDPAVRERAARLVLPFLNRIPVEVGDAYAVPPGTVHAIGRGVRLFEIQQTSDVTYRVWDWNRPDEAERKRGRRAFRPLHLDKARAVLDFRGRAPDFYRIEARAGTSEQGAREETLVWNAEGCFAANRLIFGRGARWERADRGAFDALTVVSGSLVIAAENGASVDASTGRTVLLPAAAGRVVVSSAAGARAFRSFVP